MYIFVWSAVNLLANLPSEDDQYLGTDVTESNTLKFWFQHATFDVPRYQTAAEFTNKKLPGSSKVHERTKKGLLAHGVGYVTSSSPQLITHC